MQLPLTTPGLTITTPHDPRGCRRCNFANHRLERAVMRQPHAERGLMPTPCGGATFTRWADRPEEALDG